MNRRVGEDELAELVTICHPLRATQDRSFVPGVGDSSAAAGARFAEVVHELAATPGCNAVLVAHGGLTIDGLRTLVGDRDVARALPQ
jgi:broad specificity phosphatase PhoE